MMSPKDVCKSTSFPFQRFLGQGVSHSHSWDDVRQSAASFVIHGKMRVREVSTYPVHSHRRGDGAAGGAVSQSAEASLTCCF